MPEYHNHHYLKCCYVLANFSTSLLYRESNNPTSVCFHDQNKQWNLEKQKKVKKQQQQ